MPRRPRTNYPGAITHVIARGNRRQPIYLDERGYRIFLAVLGAVSRGHGWRCHAYCLMPNHYHAVIETPEENLSAGMQYLNSRYAEWFNRRFDLDGHLFQGRFYSVLVEGDYHLLELSRYLPLNPVRAGLCSRPADWRWSSYRAVAGLASAPAFLDVERVLGMFASTPERARRLFHSFVHDALRPRPGRRAL
jgi:putative transposase